MWRAGATCSLAIGCIGHTTLLAPPSTLTAEQRLAWFQALSGRGVRTRWTVQTRTGVVTDVHKTILGAGAVQICVLNMQLVPCEYRPEPIAPPAAPSAPAGQAIPDGPVADR